MFGRFFCIVIFYESSDDYIFMVSDESYLTLHHWFCQVTQKMMLQLHIYGHLKILSLKMITSQLIARCLQNIIMKICWDMNILVLCQIKILLMRGALVKILLRVLCSIVLWVRKVNTVDKNMKKLQLEGAAFPKA